jgi:carboxylesterase type B
MTCPTRRDAPWFARAGAPTYLYRFTHAPNVMGSKAGAFHGAELVSLLPERVREPRPGLHRRGSQARRGDDRLLGAIRRDRRSNGGGAPAWPRHSEAADLHVVPAADRRLRRAQCDVWDQIGG